MSDGRNAINSVFSGAVDRSVDYTTTLMPSKPHGEHGTDLSAASRKRAASSFPDNAGVRVDGPPNSLGPHNLLRVLVSSATLDVLVIRSGVLRLGGP